MSSSTEQHHGEPRRKMPCLAAMILFALVAFGQGGTMAQAEDDKLLEKGLALVRKGSYKKAARVLTRVNEEAGGQSLPALVGLSAAHNGLEEHARAYTLAKEALATTEDASLRGAAATELAHAIATGNIGGEGDELQEALREVRRYLALEPAGDLSDRLRQRLCSTRRLAGATPGPGASSPLEVGEGVGKPVGIHVPQPHPEPGELGYLTNSERVEMQTVIDADGCVDAIEVLKTTSDAWAQMAVRQVAHWVFRPATRDGRAVAVNYRLKTQFGT